MKCSIDGCPGTYESESVAHTVRHPGQLLVIDHISADVCSACGDVLLKPDTVRRIEQLLKEQQESPRAPRDGPSLRIRVTERRAAQVGRSLSPA